MSEPRELTREEKTAVAEVKEAGEAFLYAIGRYCPYSRVRTQIEEAIVWAVRDITEGDRHV